MKDTQKTHTCSAECCIATGSCRLASSTFQRAFCRTVSVLWPAVRAHKDPAGWSVTVDVCQRRMLVFAACLRPSVSSIPLLLCLPGEERGEKGGMLTWTCYQLKVTSCQPVNKMTLCFPVSFSPLGNWKPTNFRVHAWKIKVCFPAKAFFVS